MLPASYGVGRPGLGAKCSELSFVKSMLDLYTLLGCDAVETGS